MLFQELKAFVDILRPENFVGIIAIVVLSSIGIEPDNPDLSMAFRAGLGVALCAGAGCVINDFFDLTINRVVHPWRVIPKGVMTRERALKYYFVLLTLSLGLLWTVGAWAFTVGVFFNVALLLYSWRMRQVNGPAANVIIAMTMGSACAFGGFVTGIVVDWVVLTLFMIGFLLSLAREILADAEDLKGDSVGRLRTLPMIVGIPFALRCSAAALLSLVFFSYIPFAIGAFGVGYALAITLLNLFIFYGVKQMLQGERVLFSGKAGKVLKVEALCYPLAVSLSGIAFA